jgi:hypothetical protein
MEIQLVMRIEVCDRAAFKAGDAADFQRNFINAGEAIK